MRRPHDDHHDERRGCTDRDVGQMAYVRKALGYPALAG
jgi:hypothetical protein